MDQLTLPCTDCDGARARLQAAGFRVASCEPAPGRPDACLLSFDHPSPGATATAALSTPGVVHDPVPLTDTQVRAAQAIVNLFETSAVLGVYGQVTVIAGDTGHLTYGRSQTTLSTGNLHLMVQRYCAVPGARFAAPLEGYLARLQARDVALDHDAYLANLLRACADDPLMRDVQDEFFDEHYWKPALASAAHVGVRSALGIAVVYDSTVHGSWEAIRDKVLHDAGPVSDLGEIAWIAAYIETRRSWLATSPRDDLRKCVYRMDAFGALAQAGHWGLALPLVVRGAEISTTTLAGMPPGCYDGPQPGTRPLALQAPMARGLDVRLMQLGLSRRSMDVTADGVFGNGCVKALTAYQTAHGLPVTGTADAALVAQLARMDT